PAATSERPGSPCDLPGGGATRRQIRPKSLPIASWAPTPPFRGLTTIRTRWADRPIGGPGDPVHIVGSIVATEATISDDPAVAAMGRPRAPCSGLGASVVDARGPDQHEERGIWLADVKTDGAARKMTGGQRQGPIRSSHNAWAWAWLRCRRC